MHASDEQQTAQEAGYGAAEGSETPTGPPQVLPDPALQPGQPGQPPRIEPEPPDPQEPWSEPETPEPPTPRPPELPPEPEPGR